VSWFGRNRNILALLVTLSAGCSMTPDGDPLRPRYFTPEPAPTTASRASAGSGPELRLGWIRSSEHLGRRIAWRDGESVLGFYERRRWTESPVVYLERAVCRRLFVDDTGVRRALTAEHPTLDVTLTAFEELRADPDAEDQTPTGARVALSYVLLLGDEHLAEGQVVAEEALERPKDEDGELEEIEDDGPLLAQAMGRALEAAVNELAVAVESHLGAGR
jgi:hypothetical protein